MSRESQCINSSVFNFATSFFLSIKFRVTFQNFQLLVKRN